MWDLGFWGYEELPSNIGKDLQSIKNHSNNLSTIECSCANKETLVTCYENRKDWGSKIYTTHFYPWEFSTPTCFTPKTEIFTHSPTIENPWIFEIIKHDNTEINSAFRMFSLYLPQSFSHFDSLEIVIKINENEQRVSLDFLRHLNQTTKIKSFVGVHIPIENQLMGISTFFMQKSSIVIRPIDKNAESKTNGLSGFLQYNQTFIDEPYTHDEYYVDRFLVMYYFLQKNIKNGQVQPPNNKVRYMMWHTKEIVDSVQIVDSDDKVLLEFHERDFRYYSRFSHGLPKLPKHYGIVYFCLRTEKDCFVNMDLGSFCFSKNHRIVFYPSLTQGRILFNCLTSAPYNKNDMILGKFVINDDCDY
jgi:hypothetical protein